MKILVSAKRVTDPYTTLTLKSDGSGLDLEDVDYKMNPFCEIAVEEALRVIDEVDDGEVIAVSMGSEDAEREIRQALAMGADRGIHVECNEDELDSDLVAQLFAKLCAEEEPDLVILGKQATDGDNNQVGQLLAEYCGWPQATFAYELNIDDDKNGAEVKREVDGGVETVRLSFPAVITTDLRLNEPRYASLQGIMKAKRKPLDVFDPDELGVEIKPKVEVVGWDMPQKRQAGVLVDSVEALFDKLKNEAKVI